MQFFNSEMISILFIITVATLLNGITNETVDADVYSLEQAIDLNDYIEISQINIRTMKQNQQAAHIQSYTNQQYSNEMSPEELRFMAQPAHTPIAVTNSVNIQISDEDRKKIQNQIEIAVKKSNPMYRLRICKATSNCFTSTFTSLNDILAAEMECNLTIHLNNNNRPSSMSIKTDKKSNGPQHNNNKSLIKINAIIQTIKTAQTPDTDTYLQKVKKEIEMKEKTAAGGNESFLSKYWIYIVPFVIIMFIMQIANPEGQAAS
jgi:hypothetical protein